MPSDSVHMWLLPSSRQSSVTSWTCIGIWYSQAPHTKPSIVMVLTLTSISFISVSSSQGFTSRTILDLAIRAGFLDFFSAYAFRRSSLIFAASASCHNLPWCKRSTTDHLLCMSKTGCGRKIQEFLKGSNEVKFYLSV